MTEYTEIEKLNIKIGRLNRRLDRVNRKLKDSRAKLLYYRYVIDMQPHLMRNLVSFQERNAQIKRIDELDNRVKEQARLIEFLKK